MCVSYLRDEMVRLRDMLTQKDTQLEKFVDMLVKRRINFFVIDWEHDYILKMHVLQELT